MTYTQNRNKNRRRHYPVFWLAYIISAGSRMHGSLWLAEPRCVPPSRVRKRERTGRTWVNHFRVEITGERDRKRERDSGSRGTSRKMNLGDYSCWPWRGLLCGFHYQATSRFGEVTLGDIYVYIIKNGVYNSIMLIVIAPEAAGAHFSGWVSVVAQFRGYFNSKLW